MHSLYGSKTRGPEDDSVQSKHVALISHYMFNISTVVFDGPSCPFNVETVGGVLNKCGYMMAYCHRI